MVTEIKHSISTDFYLMDELLTRVHKLFPTASQQ